VNKSRRGYFAIGVFHPKNSVNIGTLWRSAYVFGASFIFTIGRRYKKQSSDTLKTYRHVPLFHFIDFEDFKNRIPYDAQLICVELDDEAESLREFKHPQRSIYLLGAEDNGISKEILKERQIIQVPSMRKHCLNVSVAGSIVMYDRIIKETK
jgi:tRNA G18 (ribose-2'-O)-methylase SpoU